MCERNERTECHPSGLYCDLGSYGPDGKTKCKHCGWEPVESIARPAERTFEPVIWYLTDETGQRTAEGLTELTEEDLAKVAFQAGPGVIRTHLALIDEQLFVLGVLQLPYYNLFSWDGHCEEDSLWYDGCENDARQVMEDSARAIAKIVRRRLAALLPGTYVTVEDEGDASNVVAAIPLASVSDSGETWDMLAAAFGERSRAHLDDRKRLVQQQKRQIIVEGARNEPTSNFGEALLTADAKEKTAFRPAWTKWIRKYFCKYRIGSHAG